jgi:hypothetical protein
MTLTPEQRIALGLDTPSAPPAIVVTKEQIAQFLSTHDSIRTAEHRTAIFEYIRDTFAKAEKYDELAAHVHSHFDALYTRVTAIENKQAAVAAIEAK